MNGFSASEAALEGFRISRENPRAFAWWIAVSFFFSVLGGVISLNMPDVVRHGLDTLATDEQLSAATLFEALIAVSPLLIAQLVFLCMMAAAVYRLIFRHEDARFGYLRLGSDELRLLGLTLMGIGLIIGLVAAVTLVLSIIVSVVVAIMPGQLVRVSAVAEIALLLIVAFVVIRLSLAPAATFAERRIRLFESWTLTRGVFWRTAGAYALALACIVVVGFFALVLFTAVAGIVILLAGGQVTDVGEIFHPEQFSLSTYLNPGFVAYLVVGSVFQALYFAVMAAPGAIIYERMHGSSATPLRTSGAPS